MVIRKKFALPLLPVETRWNTVQDSLQYYATHWSDIAEIMDTHLKPPNVAYRYMEDIQVKRAASDMIAVLKPISIALDKFQRDNCLLGTVLPFGTS